MWSLYPHSPTAKHMCDNSPPSLPSVKICDVGLALTSHHTHTWDGPVRWALGDASPRTGSFLPSSPPPRGGSLHRPIHRPTRRANAHTLVNDGCVKFALLPSHASLPPSLSLLQFVSQNEREAVTLARISPFHCSVLCLVMIHHHSRDSPPLGRGSITNGHSRTGGTRSSSATPTLAQVLKEVFLR